MCASGLSCRQDGTGEALAHHALRTRIESSVEIALRKLVLHRGSVDGELRTRDVLRLVTGEPCDHI